MTIFQDYIDILIKCHTIQIENNSFLPFIEKYPQYKRYYNFVTGEFDSENFLYQNLNDGTFNLLDTCYIKKKEVKNIFAYFWTLIEMENSYLHIAYCLPVILQRVNKDMLFTNELSSILSQPHNIKDIGNEIYINIQSNIIDFLGFTYPNETKNILKKYKFDMINSSESYQSVLECEDTKDIKFRSYLKYLKYKSTFLTETFPCNINYNI